MFGEQAGAEARMSKMNQFVITKLHGVRRSFWVFHTRATSATSILIEELKKVKLTGEQASQYILEIQREQQLSEQEYRGIKECSIVKWKGKGEEVPLEACMIGVKEACVLGFTKEREDDAAT